MIDTDNLCNTTDAMVWAETFCKMFDGKVVSARDSTYGVDPGLMVGWFANAMAAQEMKMNAPLVAEFLGKLEKKLLEEKNDRDHEARVYKHLNSN